MDASAITTPEAQVRRRRKRAPKRSGPRPLPSREELLLWFRYDPDAGILYRIAEKRGSSSRRILLDQPRGINHCNNSGYLATRLPGRSNVLVSRIIWKIQTGEDPGANQIDHVNNDRTDNRWVNLRLASHSQNMRNRRKTKANSVSKLKGVGFIKNHKGELAYITARIRAHGKQIHLGVFPTEEAAHAAYCEAARKYHGEFARPE